MDRPKGNKSKILKMLQFYQSWRQPNQNRSSVYLNVEQMQMVREIQNKIEALNIPIKIITQNLFLMVM